MSVKSEKLSMPMSQAGIIGFSSDMKIEGMEIDAKMVLGAIFVFVVVVKVATMFGA